MNLYDIPRPAPEPWNTELTLAEDATHRYVYDRYAFNNHQLRVYSKDGLDAIGPDWVWTYPSRPAVEASLMDWDPDTEDEPTGYAKRKGGTRRAPRREENPVYNMPRCMHGAYMADGCANARFCPDHIAAGTAADH